MSAELNFFDTYILMAIVEEIVPKQTFFKDRYFPTGDGDIFASDKVLTEYRKGDRKMAAFVSSRAGDIPMERRGFEIHEYQPAFIAPSRLLTQDDLRKRGFGEAIYALDPKHMVVKIPMTAEGLKAIKALSAKGIPTNCTLIFSANQALLAARAGATYVSPFLGRLDDISQRGIELIETIHDMFLNYPDIETQIIAASVRNPMHVTDCALAGADIATVPYKVIEQMLHHPLTDSGIEKFKEDYCKVFGE